MNKNVILYSTPFCHFCHLAKQYFSEKGIAFVEVDVAEDDVRRQEMMHKSGQLGVPVIEIGEQVIIGFNRPRIEELLSV